MNPTSSHNLLKHAIKVANLNEIEIFSHYLNLA